MKEYEQSVINETMDDKNEFMERLAGNPIHAYRLMKRLYFDWQLIEKEIKTDNWQSASPYTNSNLEFVTTSPFIAYRHLN